ncbi:hypothetical protein KVR01_009675 [Diaporthe batatas]|uniref:uncharacterized protein n=1 Tax=Diaporthe batatas TaxID=748121 RepID=UPI001D05C06A|nr:uncharacterized protein KVR01_009675 [Diaporthe batatas]KAG8160139.1 hypothetical protein KVR01_009675 [Diaporthe batatas]
MTRSTARTRDLPYLHRNWIIAINYLQSAALGFKSNEIHQKLANGHDDHDTRPAKRRRYAENSPDSGLGQDLDSLLLPSKPGEIQRAIRIEVLKIAHKDSSRQRHNPALNGTIPPAIKDAASIRARCKITITTARHMPGEARILYCDSQICTIKTFQNPAGLSQMARVYLPQPFHIPEEKIYVERDDDAVFDLADQYSMSLELESAGDRNWPPLNLADTSFDENVFLGHSSASRHWTLAAEIPKIIDGGRRSGLLRLHKGSCQGVRTDFVLDVDVRAATALPERHSWNSRERVSPCPATLADQQDETLPLTNGQVNGAYANGINGNLVNGTSGLIDDDAEEEAEGELTPSRSLRIRGTKNYNLKDLSNRAQGRKGRNRLAKAELRRADADRILYHLPRESGPVKEVLVLGFACCFCHASHQSLAQLRAHLPSHPQYRFEVSISSGKMGAPVDVSCIAVNGGPFLRPTIYQLGKPTKAFDLDKYVEGDDSWVKSRLGPHNDDGPVVSAHKASHARTGQVRPSQRNGGRRKEKKVLVPDTKQPLFDSLSKAKLIPGTEVRQSVADDTWLIQKHQDIVQDFIDVDAAEKDYIKQWDAFIHKRHISSDAFISRAVLEFVNEKMPWLLSSQSRIQEFGKHLTVLIARGLDADTVRQVQSRIQEARSQKPPEPEQASSQQPPREAQHRSSKGCAICGRNVRGPQLLICANEECKKPLYHEECIKYQAQIPIEHQGWRCNECAPAHNGHGECVV